MTTERSPYVPGVDEDVFVSYAHIDNDDNLHWVSELHAFLLTRLRQLLGTDELRIWRDERLGGMDLLHQVIERKVRRSALLLAVITPKYLKSPWCETELNGFIAAQEHGVAGDEHTSRIVRVLKTPLEDVAEPRGLSANETTGYRFYEESGNGFVEFPVASKCTVQDRHGQKYEDLAQNIARLLRRLRQAGASSGHSHIATRDPHSPHNTENLNRKLAAAPVLGRDVVLDRLLAAWADDRTRVVSLIGPGGSGKTAVVWEFIKRLRESSDPALPKPAALYAWSFANQGHDDFETTAIKFATSAVVHFGSLERTHGRFRQLASLLRQRRCLLIMDGVETQQDQDGELRQLKDEEGIRYFLGNVSDNDMPHGGLVLLTSQLGVSTLARRNNCIDITLDALSPEAGAALLYALNVGGTEEERRRASEEQRGNPLCLVLLAGFLAETNRTIWQRHEFNLPKGGDYHKWVTHTIRAYLKHLQLRERKFLRLLGLFGRSMQEDDLAALEENAQCAAFLKELKSTTDRHLMYARLCRLHLLTAPPRNDPWQKWDTHPLIRQHVAEEFRHKYAAEWREAHGVLFERYRAICERGLAPAGTKLVDFLGAVRHGCLAHRYQQAYQMYRYSIAKDFRGFDTEDLRFAPETLIALSAFFKKNDATYEQPVSHLDPYEQAYILTRISYCLESLGELHRAIAPRLRSNRLFGDLYSGTSNSKERYETARSCAYGSEVLSLIELRLGRLPEALESATDAVRQASSAQTLEPLARQDRQWCADNCQNAALDPPVPAWLRVCSTRSARAAVLHRMGRMAEAAEEVRESIRTHDTNCQPLYVCAKCGQTRTGHCETEDHFGLHSEPGMRQCIVALDTAADEQQVRAALEAADRMSAWSARDSAHATDTIKALHMFLLGTAEVWARMTLPLWGRGIDDARLVQAEGELHRAADQLEHSKKSQFLGDVLLHRGIARRQLGRSHDALSDANEVLALGERYGMRLLTAEALVLKAHLTLDAGESEAATAICERASDVIDTVGYELCRPAVALLRARVTNARRLDVHLALERARAAVRSVPAPRFIAELRRYESEDWD